MNTIQVSNGDIQLSSGGKIQFVKGTSKLVQDLALWLKEEYGVGFTTPSFGSLLPSMIGQAITASTTSNIQSEIYRVLGLYQANQSLQLRSAQNTNQLSRWNKSEIINNVDDVQVLVGTGFVNATVSLTTLNGVPTSLNFVITPNGIQVTNNG